MDEITKSALAAASAAHPGAAIRFTHQFLDGTEGRECGYVPHDADEAAVTVKGAWWRNQSSDTNP